MMRSSLFMSCLAIAACSVTPDQRILLDGTGYSHADFACYHHRLRTAHPIDDEHPTDIDPSWVGDNWCDLEAAGGGRAGRGRLVMHYLEDALSVCEYHLRQTPIYSPVNLDKIVSPITDPFVRFDLIGLLPGLDNRREFQRTYVLDGVLIDFRQTLRDSQSALLEIEINSCTTHDAIENVRTDGRPIHFKRD